jgi:hypothetical protein
MPYLILKFLHVGSMFLATALAVGPSVMLYLIARTGEPTAIRRAFGLATPVFRVGGAVWTGHRLRRRGRTHRNHGPDRRLGPAPDTSARSIRAS